MTPKPRTYSPPAIKQETEPRPEFHHPAFGSQQGPETSGPVRDILPVSTTVHRPSGTGDIQTHPSQDAAQEIRCQFIILARKDQPTPDFPSDTGFPLALACNPPRGFCAAYRSIGMVSDFVLGSYVLSSKPKTRSEATHLFI